MKNTYKFGDIPVEITYRGTYFEKKAKDHSETETQTEEHTEQEKEEIKNILRQKKPCAHRGASCPPHVPID